MITECQAQYHAEPCTGICQVLDGNVGGCRGRDAVGQRMLLQGDLPRVEVESGSPEDVVVPPACTIGTQSV